MDKELDKRLGAVSDGQAAALASRYVEPVLTKKMQDVDDEIFAILKRGAPLDPVKAVQAWQQKFAYQMVMRELDKKQALGQSAARSIAPEMNKS